MESLTKFGRGPEWTSNGISRASSWERRFSDGAAAGLREGAEAIIGPLGPVDAETEM